MPKKRKYENKEYTKRARILRKLGYRVKYNPSKKTVSGAHYKSAVSKFWNKAKFYVGVKGQEFHRYKSQATRIRWKKSGAISESQEFPKGFFMETPPGVEKGKYKLRLGKKGVIKVTTTDKRMVNDTILALDASELADDSKASLEKLLKGKKRPRKFLLRSNGHSRKADRHEDGGFDDLETFNRYIEDELIPQLNDAEFDYQRWGTQVFGVILQYTPKGGKKVEGEGKVFDFKNGSIFDEKSKRVYHRKKFLNRKKHKMKKGKGKGK